MRREHMNPKFTFFENIFHSSHVQFHKIVKVEAEMIGQFQVCFPPTSLSKLQMTSLELFICSLELKGIAVFIGGKCHKFLKAHMHIS